MLFQRQVTHSYGVAINRNPILFRKATTNYHTLKKCVAIDLFIFLPNFAAVLFRLRASSRLAD